MATPTAHLTWQPAPHGKYFGHISMSAEADGVCLLLVRVETGRVPFRGPDTDLDDEYPGAVYLSPTPGTSPPVPIAGVTVQYVDADAPLDPPLQEVATPEAAEAFRRRYLKETQTDKYGRHRLWLSPGNYRWRYVTPMGVVSNWEDVTVPRGHSVSWETARSVGDGDEAEVVVDKQERELARVTEELLLDWHREDGNDFSWLDVESTIAEVCKRTPGLRQITLARPARADLVFNLQRVGVYCFDTMWRDIEFAAAYRNLLAVMDAKYFEPCGYDRILIQMQRAVRFTDDKKRVKYIEGFPHYLPDARASAVHFALQAAAMEGPRGGQMITTVGNLTQRDTPKGVNECLQEMFGAGYRVTGHYG